MPQNAFPHSTTYTYDPNLQPQTYQTSYTPQNYVPQSYPIQSVNNSYNYGHGYTIPDPNLASMNLATAQYYNNVQDLPMTPHFAGNSDPEKNRFDDNNKKF